MPPLDSVRVLSAEEKRVLIERINTGDGNPRMRPILDVPIERAMIDEENRTVRLSVSSETPVERWWGEEVLDHTAKAVDLSRLKPGVFGPVLASHDAFTPENHIGVVDEATLDEKRKKVSVAARFSKNNPTAEMIFKDVIDSIRGNASIGYEIIDLQLEEEKKNAPPRYRVTKWAIYEVSFVSVPADTRIGVGRSADHQPTAPVSQRKEGVMPPESENPTGAAVVETPAPTVTQPEARTSPGEDPGTVERKRIADIRALGKIWEKWGGQQLAEEFVRGSGSFSEFRDVLMERLAAQANSPVRVAGTPDLGMKTEEIKRFSLWKVIRATAFPQERTFVDAAAYEREVCGAYSEKNKRFSTVEGGYMIPGEVMRRKASEVFLQHRDLQILGPGTGGYLVQTDVLVDEFIELLRNYAATMQVARVIPGLTGNVAIPKKTAGGTGYWVNEITAPTESQLTLGQGTLTPKNVGAFTDITRLLAMQTSAAVESLVTEDLTETLSILVDAAAIKGGGSGEPSGILTLPSGIGNVNMGDNGGSPTWAKIIEFLATTGKQNAIRGGNMGWMTNWNVVGTLMSTMRNATYGDIPIWNDANPSRPLVNYPVYMTGNVPSNYTKGTHSTPDLSALIFGNWSDLVIGIWDGIDIARDTAAGFLTGAVRIRVLLTLDIMLRIAASFTISDEIITI